MLQKIKQLFTGKSKDFPSHIKFKDGIKAIAMEVYKGVCIFYLAKPKPSAEYSDEYQLIYHILHNKDFYFEEADTIEDLERLAHEKIDNKFK